MSLKLYRTTPGGDLSGELVSEAIQAEAFELTDEQRAALEKAADTGEACSLKLTDEQEATIRQWAEVRKAELVERERRGLMRALEHRYADMRFSVLREITAGLVMMNQRDRHADADDPLAADGTDPADPRLQDAIRDDVAIAAIAADAIMDETRRYEFEHGLQEQPDRDD